MQNKVQFTGTPLSVLPIEGAQDLTEELNQDIEAFVARMKEQAPDFAAGLVDDIVMWLQFQGAPGCAVYRGDELQAVAGFSAPSHHDGVIVSVLVAAKDAPMAATAALRHTAQWSKKLGGEGRVYTFSPTPAIAWYESVGFERMEGNLNNDNPMRLSEESAERLAGEMDRSALMMISINETRAVTASGGVLAGAKERIAAVNRAFENTAR